MNTKFPCIFCTFLKQSEIGQNVCIQVKNINTSVKIIRSKYLPDPTWTRCPVLFMINWEMFLFIPRSALGHLPLTFLCSEISGGTLHLSVPLVQPWQRDERCAGQIVRVLTFCGIVNNEARARIRSTSLYTSWNWQSDLCRVLSLVHDISGTISKEWLLSLRSNEHCPPTSDLIEQQTSILFCSPKSVTKSEFQWNILNLIKQLAQKIAAQKDCKKKKYPLR